MGLSSSRIEGRFGAYGWIVVLRLLLRRKNINSLTNTTVPKVRFQRAKKGIRDKKRKKGRPYLQILMFMLC